MDPNDRPLPGRKRRSDIPVAEPVRCVLHCPAARGVPGREPGRKGRRTCCIAVGFRLRWSRARWWLGRCRRAPWRPRRSRASTSSCSRTQAGGDSAKRKARARGGKVQREFSRALNGFSATLDAKALGGGEAGPGGRLRRARSRDHARRHAAEPADVGAGPDRPAQPAAEPQLHLRARRAANVTAYIIDTGIRSTHADFGGRAVGRLRRRRRRHGRRLQRPRHARRRHGRRHELRRRQGRQAGRGAGPQLQRLGLDLGRDRGHRLGDRQPAAGGPRWPT